MIIVTKALLMEIFVLAINSVTCSEKVSSRMDQDNIALGPFVSKMLYYYKVVLRHTFASILGDNRQIADLYFFVRTDTGRPLTTKDVTAAVKRSCKQFVDADREVTSLGMRHSWATHWFQRFKTGQAPAHLQTG